ncbi:13266_t:CDS:2 [Acaulospora colombiana]|uniref:13266_t:CDS:1 n=1 Tax=Acaulospora colombiana TaxID=27376 RepID=A0ACA9KWQ2_9GLOM|nr:13266_t:CDS:2 [Acaulospora colombiana]
MYMRSSAFSYPSPATKIPRTDISLREILDTYRDNNDLLKQILAAKAEEDKARNLEFYVIGSQDKRAEEEKYKTEALRLQCKQVELEMLKEQKKPPTIFTGVPHIHSPYLPIPPPIATTPTSATRLSPPSSANNGHDSMSYSHNGISSQSHSYNSVSQRPSLTLSIPSFPIITTSPTTMHNQHSFSTPTSSVQEHPHSASSHRYTQSPTTMNSNNKRPKLNSESEVDHEYVMEALRQKVQRNQENPAKKYMNVFKPRSVSTPVVSHSNSSPSQPHPHSHQHHQSRDQPKHQQQTVSPVDPPIARSPIPPLPPMNVHSPGMNQEQATKS